MRYCMRCKSLSAWLILSMLQMIAIIIPVLSDLKWCALKKQGVLQIGKAIQQRNRNKKVTYCVLTTCQALSRVFSLRGLTSTSQRSYEVGINVTHFLQKQTLELRKDGFTKLTQLVSTWTDSRSGAHKAPRNIKKKKFNLTSNQRNTNYNQISYFVLIKGKT